MEKTHVTKDGTQVTVTPSNMSTPNPLITTAAMMKGGTVPNNNQLQQTIESTRVALSGAQGDAHLSTRGQQLVEDTRAVLDSASRMLTEKNQDERLQRLVSNSIAASKETRAGVEGSSMPLDKSDLQSVKSEARSVFNAAKEVTIFALRSGQFREILLEILDLLQTIIRSASDKVATQPDFNRGVAVDMMRQDVMPAADNAKQVIFEKLRVLITKLSSRPEYTTAIEHLFVILDQMEEKAKVIRSSAASNDMNLPTTRLEQIWQDSSLLIEEFSGKGTMDALRNHIHELFLAIRADPEAREFMWEARTYLSETIKNPALLNDRLRSDYGRSLIERGRILLSGKYRSQFQTTLDSARVILTGIKNDSSRQDFTQKLQKLGGTFALDAQGRPDLFVIQESLMQMKSILIPVLSRSLDNLPIPRIQGSNPKYDFSIEGLVLRIGDLLPNLINLATKTDTVLDVQKLSSQKRSTKVVMELEQVRAHFENIKFTYRRKKLPRMEDTGLASVDLSQGSGIYIKLVWKLTSTGNSPLQLDLLKVKCNIDRLAIAIREAKHNILYKLATKLFAKSIKKQMANAIVNNIISTIQPLGVKLNELFRSRPMTGLFARANDQMKASLFVAEGEKSLITRAKEVVTSGADKIKTQVAATKHELTRDEGFPSLGLSASEKARREYNYVWNANNYKRYDDNSDFYTLPAFNQPRSFAQSTPVTTFVIPSHATPITVIHEDEPEILQVMSVSHAPSNAAISRTLSASAPVYNGDYARHQPEFMWYERRY